MDRRNTTFRDVPASGRILCRVTGRCGIVVWRRYLATRRNLLIVFPSAGIRLPMWWSLVAGKRNGAWENVGTVRWGIVVRDLQAVILSAARGCVITRDLCRGVAWYLGVAELNCGEQAERKQDGITDATKHRRNPTLDFLQRGNPTARRQTAEPVVRAPKYQIQRSSQSGGYCTIGEE